MKCYKIAILFAILATTNAVDYCSKDLCGQQKHIACGNNGGFGPKCPAERSVVPMTPDVINLLLQKHNTARMNIANGKVNGFPTADRMIQMSWDNELATLAAMNAKTCVMDHDKCRNTAAFKYAGQNLAYTTSTSNYKDAKSAINELFDAWYSEIANFDMKQINSLTDITGSNGRTFGHFSQIIMANSSKIGCAMVNYFADSWKTTLLTCDYSQTNLLTSPIYTTGQPCSGCKSGCSASFPGLCNTSEVVNYV